MYYYPILGLIAAVITAVVARNKNRNPFLWFLLGLLLPLLSLLALAIMRPGSYTTKNG